MKFLHQGFDKNPQMEFYFAGFLRVETVDILNFDNVRQHVLSGHTEISFHGRPLKARVADRDWLCFNDMAS